MTYIAPFNLTDADATTAATLTAVKAKVGMIPKLYSTLATLIPTVSTSSRPLA